MKKYLLVVDQGTTSTRAILFDQFGQTVAKSQQALRQHFPGNGWVEHDPEEIWQAVLNTCKNVIGQSAIAIKDILAIGITNQRETTIVWHRKSGMPIYNAIVWQDRRTTDICQKIIEEGKEAIVSNKTGLLIDPYFSASKIGWILDHVPGARDMATRGELLFGTVDSFLLWRFSQGEVHATDATNASRTSIFNIRTQQWDSELLDIFNVPQNILPQVMDCAEDFAVTELLGGKIPIAAMMGDQQAALFGQACFTEGSMKCTYGTGAFLLMNTGDKLVQSKHHLLSTIAYRLHGKITYALEGSIFAAGSILQWLRDQLHLLVVTSDSAAMASSVPDNGGVYFIPAFTGLGAPYWKPNIRASIPGITRDTTAAHIVRAGLEAIVYQTYDLILAMVKDGATMPKVLKMDGGMAANDWLMQFLADIFNGIVERPVIIETTALGTAYLAAMQQGLYNSLDEIASMRKIEKNFFPNLEIKKREMWYQGWRDAIRSIVY